MMGRKPRTLVMHMKERNGQMCKSIYDDAHTPGQVSDQPRTTHHHTSVGRTRSRRERDERVQEQGVEVKHRS